MSMLLELFSNIIKSKLFGIYQKAFIIVGKYEELYYEYKQNFIYKNI